LPVLALGGIPRATLVVTETPLTREAGTPGDEGDAGDSPPRAHVTRV
jgi:hypothetical protein